MERRKINKVLIQFIASANRPPNTPARMYTQVVKKGIMGREAQILASLVLRTYIGTYIPR